MHTPPSIAAQRSAPPAAFDKELIAVLPYLRRRARFLTGDSIRAEDLVQDTLERALRFRASFVPGSNLRAWAMRILSNTFISGGRRQSIERRVLELAAHDPNGWTRGTPSALKLGLTRALERELERLPARIGATLRLVDLEESSYREAADELQVPVGTIMSRLHRGRSRLAAVLREPAPSGLGSELPTALSA